jgi:flagellar assembly factor FliW
MGTYLVGKSNSGGTFTLDAGLGQRILETTAPQPQSADSLTIKTTRFGLLAVSRGKIITVWGGLLGFPDDTQYVVLNHDDDVGGPFRWFQSVGNPALAFVIIDPWVFKPDYAIELPDEVCDSLRLSTVYAPMVFAIVTVPLDPTMMRANLQGPLVINAETRQAVQAVLTNSPYTTQHPIFSELLRNGGRDDIASRITDHSEV